MLTIKNNNFIGKIDLKGAYITDLSYKGKKVLFDRSQIRLGDSMKIRGGMHVCAPNFSDDKILNELKSHGFGRNLTWKVLDCGEDFLDLGLRGVGTYEKVDFEISYKLEEDGLRTRLLIKNKGTSPVPVAPAFHPYFRTSFDELVISDLVIDKESLPSSIFVDRENLSFKTKDFEIAILACENVGVYTLWSDFLDDYICLEPTYNGKSFADEDKTPFVLESGKDFGQSFLIRVRENQDN